MVSAIWLIGLVAAMAEAYMNATVLYDTSTYMLPGSNMSVAIIPEVLDQSSHTLNATGMERRTAISVKVAVMSIGGNAATIIVGADSAMNLYNDIAAKIKAMSNANSCTLNYGTAYGNGHFEGYAFKATTTRSNCNTTALLKTIQGAVRSCATKLSKGGATTGCCKFNHGGT